MTGKFPFPPLTESSSIPSWEGCGFRVGQEFVNILQYSTNDEGWNDDLTEFHEEAAGDQHFIDNASREYAINELRKCILSKSPSILEVGCSSGFMLKRIHKAFPDATLIGSDVVNAPLQKLAIEMPWIPLVRFDLTHCPLPSESLDAVVMLNVLEHIDNDTLALQQAYRILKPGGTLIVEVPAGPHLYDAYDKALLHYRRYNLPALQNMLKSQGFKILTKSHLGFFLYPGFWLVKKRNRYFLTASEIDQCSQLANDIRTTGSNKFLHAVMNIELWLGRFLSYPVGIRCLVSCMK